MVAADHSPAGPPPAFEPPRPPIIAVALTSMALVIAGGIYSAAYLPHKAPLTLPVILLAVSIACLVVNAIALVRLRDFAWYRFFQVGRWALLAYGIIAGMLEYIFVTDGVSGNLLILFTLTLLVFAVNVPLLLAFSVARYQAVGS